MIETKGRRSGSRAVLRFSNPFLTMVMSLLPFTMGFRGICVHPGRTWSFLRSRQGPADDDCIGVGIDLGTTNSAIAFLDEDNKPRIIEIPNNGRTIKSVVAYEGPDSGGEDFSTALVGNDALEWERKHSETAYRHVKRVIGLGSTFLPKETREVVPHLVPRIDDGVEETKKGKFKKSKNKPPTLLKLFEDAKVNPCMLYSLYGKRDRPQISPETISSCILQKLLHVAHEHTGKTITRAVIGVPAYFDDMQREATIRAAKACGIEKVKLLREPEAAALAYGVGKDSSGDEELVLVFDLGGGTYDVSILLIEKGLTEIVCTSGNAQLGGTNFDAKIAQHLSKLIGARFISESSNDMLLRAAESIRIYLSNNRVANLALPASETGWIELKDVNSVIVPLTSKEGNIDDGGSEGIQNSTHVFCQLTRKEMESLCVDEFQGLIRPIREVAIMAGALLPGDARPGIVESALEIESAYSEVQQFYDSEDDAVGDTEYETPVLSGDDDLRSAKKMQQKGRKKAREVAKEDKKYLAESRKVQANQNSKVRMNGISGRPISRVVLVGGATRMPTIGRIISSLTGIVPQKTVDPDEAVALGCAVHVGVLDGKEEMGVVLNPLQAALVRALVDKARREGQLDEMSLSEEDEFTNAEIF